MQLSLQVNPILLYYCAGHAGLVDDEDLIVHEKSCFFFSSRRRHTRYIGDWSSDVCSSDLWRPNAAATSSTSSVVSPDAISRSGGRSSRVATSSSSGRTKFAVTVGAHGPGARRRSEERRVGKESRSRWRLYP